MEIYFIGYVIAVMFLALLSRGVTVHEKINFIESRLVTFKGYDATFALTWPLWPLFICAAIVFHAVNYLVQWAEGS